MATRWAGYDPIDPYYLLESDPDWWAVHDVPEPYRSRWYEVHGVENESTPTTD